MAAFTLASPDRLSRIALLAVELVDPVTLSLVHRGIGITAQGLEGKPIVNWSGCFVWLANDEKDDRWPTKFTVDPGTQPYEEEKDWPAPPKPNDLFDAPAKDRLVRITLRPTAAYLFTDGVTVVRGRLRETEDKKSNAVANAEVWIRWRNDAPAGPKWVDAPIRARTNRAGDFATFLRLPTKARPTVENGNLVVRIVVSRDGQIREKADKVPDGRIYDLPDALAWSVLTPV